MLNIAFDEQRAGQRPIAVRRIATPLPLPLPSDGEGNEKEAVIHDGPSAVTGRGDELYPTAEPWADELNSRQDSCCAVTISSARR